jgi:adenylate kinase
MSPQSFIFIGRSGCGKGTQAQLLIKHLKTIDPSRNSLYIQNGEEFRHFITGQTLTQKLAKDIYDNGRLMPEFLSVYQWAKALNERYTGSEHLIFDGMPRKLHETSVLESIFAFYKLEMPWVVNIEVSADESFKRLMARKRADDTEEDIKVRLSWFETDVAPTIDYYRNNKAYKFLNVNGERSIEAIHEDIVKSLALK